MYVSLHVQACGNMMLVEAAGFELATQPRRSRLPPPVLYSPTALRLTHFGHRPLAGLQARRLTHKVADKPGAIHSFCVIPQVAKIAAMFSNM